MSLVAPGPGGNTPGLFYTRSAPRESALNDIRQALDLFRRLGMKREQVAAEVLLLQCSSESLMFPDSTVDQAMRWYFRNSRLALCCTVLLFIGITFLRPVTSLLIVVSILSGVVYTFGAIAFWRYRKTWLFFGSVIVFVVGMFLTNDLILAQQLRILPIFLGMFQYITLALSVFLASLILFKAQLQAFLDIR